MQEIKRYAEVPFENWLNWLEKLKKIFLKYVAAGTKVLLREN